MDEKAASGSGWMAASAPPATTTSALPERISSMPCSRASVPEAQAETGVWAPARAPRSRLTAAAAPLGISIGTVMGSTRRGPFSRSVSQASSSVHTPPMPVAKATANRSWSTSVMPESFQASRAAITANWLEGSSRLASTRVSTSEAGVDTRAAKWTGSWYFSTHSSPRVWAPDRPMRAFFHIVGTSPPMGVVAPSPVMTTLRAMVLLSGINQEI